mgnify:FL=1
MTAVGNLYFSKHSMDGAVRDCKFPAADWDPSELALKLAETIRNAAE